MPKSSCKNIYNVINITLKKLILYKKLKKTLSFKLEMIVHLQEIKIFFRNIHLFITFMYTNQNVLFNHFLCLYLLLTVFYFISNLNYFLLVIINKIKILKCLIRFVCWLFRTINKFNFVKLIIMINNIVIINMYM